MTQASIEITIKILEAQFHTLAAVTPKASVALLFVYRTINGIKIIPRELQRFLCLLCSSLVWVKHSKEKLAFPQDLNGTLTQKNDWKTKQKKKKTTPNPNLLVSTGKSKAIQCQFIRLSTYKENTFINGYARPQPNKYLSPTHSGSKGRWSW